MSAHLDLERTTYLVYGLLEADEKDQVRAHLTDCSACLEAVRRLEEERGSVVAATAAAPAREEFVRQVAAKVHDRVVTIRRVRTRRLWLLGCAAAGFLAVGVAFMNRTREIEEARAALALGRLSVQRGDLWVDQTAGYVPSPGDRIRTDDPAGVTIRLEEGSKFKISRGSMVEFRGIRGPTAVLRLLEGDVRCSVVADPRPFTVEAAGATVTVVGTEFAVHVLEDQPFFKSEKRIQRPPKVAMLVQSGAVLLKTEDGELRVPGGWVALAGAKGGPWMWGEVKELETDKSLDRLLRRAPDPKPEAKPGPIETAWKERTDRAVRDCVDAVPWSRWADALVRYHKEIDDAVREERPTLPPSIDDLTFINLGWGKIRLLANELNVGSDFMQACRNKVAAGLFVEAIAEAMSGAPLTEDQRKKLLAPETLDNLLPALDPAAPALVRWKTRADKTVAFVRQLKDALDDEEYLRVTTRVGPSFLIDAYRMWLVEAANAAEAADRIARIWTEQFKVPTYAQAALAPLAAQLVKNHHAAHEKFRREYGDALSGVQELELAARLFELQAQAEKGVSEIPAMNRETRARAAAGSDKFYRLKIAN